ncbi:MAG: hypothetical protein JXM79_00030 [Sedimentisphaerales bacterium]|nr:hypothetical protein [Sedimentisphaerales bacterium]
MKKSIIVIILAFGLFASVDAGNTDWKPIGSIKARHAKEVESSNWSVGAETMDRDYTIYKNWKDYLGPLGVKKARIQGGWTKTEKRKGVYDFGWLDEIIFDMNDQGVEPWMCLCYGNSLYSDGGGVRLGAQIPKSEDSLRAWTLWVRAMVSRYMDVIDEWEIWNEPNLRSSNAARDYARFMLHTAEQVRKIQPKSKILAMSTAGVNTTFVRDVLEIAKQQDKLDLIDQVTYHPYTKNPDTSYPAVEKLRRTVREFSSHITLRQGENGCPSMRRKTKALSGYDWTEVSQAKWALRRLLGDLGRDIESSYFAIMDMKYPDEMNAKGLLKSRDDQTVEYTKPAYHAVQNLASIFDDLFIRTRNFKYTTSTELSLSVFAYENERSKFHLITLWFDGDIPSDSNTRTLVDFTFTNVRFDQPVYVDLRTGVVFEIPKSAYSTQGNTYTFTSVPCYDSPILITDRSNLHMNEK